MDLFIETDESRAKRLAHVVGEAAGPLFTPPETPRQSNEPSDDKRPQSARGERPDRSYSLEQEAYREELAFDRRRQRRRRVLAAVRLLAAVVLVPIALIARWGSCCMISSTQWSQRFRRVHPKLCNRFSLKY